MIGTLASRAHIATTSGSLNQLYAENISGYIGGDIHFHLAYKINKELCKRKAVLWHNFDCDFENVNTFNSGEVLLDENYNPLFDENWNLLFE